MHIGQYPCLLLLKQCVELCREKKSKIESSNNRNLVSFRLNNVLKCVGKREFICIVQYECFKEAIIIIKDKRKYSVKLFT